MCTGKPATAVGTGIAYPAAPLRPLLAIEKGQSMHVYGPVLIGRSAATRAGRGASHWEQGYVAKGLVAGVCLFPCVPVAGRFGGLSVSTGLAVSGAGPLECN